jgi:8-oxo-dGTP diphosphatase
MRSAAVAVVTLTVREGLEILLVRVPGTVWTLPGQLAPQGVSIEQAALDALAEQTGVRSPNAEQLFTFDSPDRDRVIVAYLALVPPQRHPVSPGGEAVEIRWYPVDDLPPLGAPDAEVAAAGLERLRAKASYSAAPFAMLPETFTLSEAQTVFEQSLGAELDPRNFRRDIVASGAVEPVGRTRASGPGRPAQLFRRGDGEFAVDARERRATRRLTRPPVDSDERT